MRLSPSLLDGCLRLISVETRIFPSVRLSHLSFLYKSYGLLNESFSFLQSFSLLFSNKCLMEGFNAFVHVLMYSHYLATTLGIDSWWRKHLTTLQLIQFVAITAQNVYSFKLGSSVRFLLVYFHFFLLFVFCID